VLVAFFRMRVRGPCLLCYGGKTCEQIAQGIEVCLARVYVESLGCSHF